MQQVSYKHYLKPNINHESVGILQNILAKKIIPIVYPVRKVGIINFPFAYREVFKEINSFGLTTISSSTKILLFVHT